MIYIQFVGFFHNLNGTGDSPQIFTRHFNRRYQIWLKVSMLAVKGKSHMGGHLNLVKF